jgi:hypothetical protein
MTASTIEPQAKPKVTEAEARDVAEAARETEWQSPSFVAELFDGHLRMDLIHPHPEPDPESEARAKPFLDALTAFMRDKVDADKIDRDCKVPPDVVQALKEMGAFGIKIPLEYGGLGLSQYHYSKAMGLVSSVCGSTTALLSAHQSIGVPGPLKYFGTPEQKKKYLPKLAKGMISAFALTEPQVGSDPAAMETHAELTPEGDWILNGEKLWCTNGTNAEVLVVMARTPSKVVNGRERKQITAFMVETAWPGVEVVYRCEFMGLKGIENGVIRFTNVRVPADSILWGEGKGLKLALITLNTGRLTLPTSAVAAAKRCLAIVRQWGNERVQWGKSVGKHDAVAQKIGAMASDTFGLEAVADLCSLLADKGNYDIRLEAAIAKLYNSERAWDIIDDTIQVRGGRGYEMAHSLKARGEHPWPVERMMRDFRINLIFEGSSEIMHLFIAREAVDRHFKVAGPLLDPHVPMGQKIGALFKTVAHYAVWYPSRYFAVPGFLKYGEFGRLAKHLRYVDRMSRKLARTTFHAMVRFGPKLEQRQMVLFRLVDAGSELFAMAAACSRAVMLAKKGQREAIELADLFCINARRRVRFAFRRVMENDDVENYRVAKDVLAGKHEWMEKGVA